VEQKYNSALNNSYTVKLKFGGWYGLHLLLGQITWSLIKMT